VPSLPQSYLFDISDSYKLTADGKRFLILDESRVRRERLLIYAVIFNLIFYLNRQLYTWMVHFQKHLLILLKFTLSMALIMIYVRKNEHQILRTFVVFVLGVPCVFVLMLNKKGSSYRQIFFELKQIASEKQVSFSPDFIYTDFESGVLPTVKTEVKTLCFTLKKYFLFDKFSFSSFMHQNIMGVISILIKLFIDKYNT
jgi:hypothetical protein